MSSSEENERDEETPETPEAAEPEAAVEETPAEAEAEQPQPTPEVAASEQAEPTPEPEAAEETTEPEAAEETTEPEAAEETTEPEAATEPQPEVVEKPEKDAVPGANLEPIAITEERELTTEEKARAEAEEEERASREAAASDDDDEELPRREAAAVPKDLSIQATGKRKSAIARVLVRPGTGTIQINGREIDDYFPRPYHQTVARQPLVTSGYDSNLEVRVRVHGGGISGQAGAVRHGIARALVELDSELRPDLKKRGLLTRDAREKERRKAGLKKARKRPQFSKR